MQNYIHPNIVRLLESGVDEETGTAFPGAGMAARES